MQSFFTDNVGVDEGGYGRLMSGAACVPAYGQEQRTPLLWLRSLLLPVPVVLCFITICVIGTYHKKIVIAKKC